METFTSTVLMMAHIALNAGRTSAEIMLHLPHKTRLLLRLSQIVLALDHGQRETADQQLAELEGDVARRAPAPVERAVAEAVRGMIDAGEVAGATTYPRLVWTSRMFSAVARGDFDDARTALAAAFESGDA